jgi:hypothetical protein
MREVVNYFIVVGATAAIVGLVIVILLAFADRRD